MVGYRLTMEVIYLDIDPVCPMVFLLFFYAIISNEYIWTAIYSYSHSAAVRHHIPQSVRRLPINKDRPTPRLCHPGILTATSRMNPGIPNSHGGPPVHHHVWRTGDRRANRVVRAPGTPVAICWYLGCIAYSCLRGHRGYLLRFWPGIGAVEPSWRFHTDYHRTVVSIANVYFSNGVVDRPMAGCSWSASKGRLCESRPSGLGPLAVVNRSCGREAKCSLSKKCHYRESAHCVRRQLTEWGVMFIPYLSILVVLTGPLQISLDVLASGGQ